MSLISAARGLFHVSQSTIRPRSVFAARSVWRSLPLTGARKRACIHLREFSFSTAHPRSENKVTVHFINRDGKKLTVEGSPGDSLLDLVIDQDLDIDGFGACEGTLACSTCHLIFDEDVYKQLGPITDEEMDMLDLAYGLTDTSRLGCQVCLTKSLNGMTARVPESVTDIRQSGERS